MSVMYPMRQQVPCLACPHVFMMDCQIRLLHLSPCLSLCGMRCTGSGLAWCAPRLPMPGSLCRVAVWAQMQLCIEPVRLLLLLLLLLPALAVCMLQAVVCRAHWLLLQKGQEL